MKLLLFLDNKMMKVIIILLYCVRHCSYFARRFNNLNSLQQTAILFFILILLLRVIYFKFNVTVSKDLHYFKIINFGYDATSIAFLIVEKYITLLLETFLHLIYGQSVENRLQFQIIWFLIKFNLLYFMAKHSQIIVAIFTKLQHQIQGVTFLVCLYENQPFFGIIFSLLRKFQIGHFIQITQINKEITEHNQVIPTASSN